MTISHIAILLVILTVLGYFAVRLGETLPYAIGAAIATIFIVFVGPFVHILGGH